VEELFEIVKGMVHLLNRRWDKRGRWQGAACMAYPVLASTKFSGRSVTATHSLEQFGMNFTNEPQAKGEILKAFQSIIHRVDIVNDLFNIFWMIMGSWALLVR